MPIKLAIITEQLKHYGGSEIYILECIKRWQNEFEIVVYTTQFNRNLFKEFGIDSDKVLVRFLPDLKNKKHRFDLLDSLVIRPRLWEKHIGEHDLYFQYLFPAQMVRKSPSIWFAAEPLRMLYDRHHHERTDDSRISFHVYPRMWYDSANQSDLNVVMNIIQEYDRNSKIENLVTNSKMMEGYLETIYGRKSDLVAYPGINLPKNSNSPVDNRTALFVGRLWDHKRVDLIIKAIALVPDGNLFIVGNGPEKKKLKRLVKSLRIKKRVKFFGNLSNKKLDQMYRSVTCAIYTPIREPFGIMPLEAASHSIPVILTPDGGYTEVLDESCAHIVAPEPGPIAEAMDSLFTDHEKTRQMGVIARQKVESFTWSNTANTLSKFFKKTLDEQQNANAKSAVRPLLGAHYYTWYQSGEQPQHWNENSNYSSVIDLPIQGTYSSNDKSLILKHLDWVEQAGLDYLVVNLQVSSNGLYGNELEATDLLFELAAEKYPSLSVCIMLSCDNADTASIENALDVLNEKYIPHDNYLYLDSKPVLWYFISESFIGYFYHHYSSIQKKMLGYQCIAASGFCYSKNLPVHYRDFFDGWSLYSPLQISNPKQWESYWNSGYQDFREDKSGDEIGVYTVCPGFDDTSLTLEERSNTKLRKIPRKETKTYIQMQEACLALTKTPDLVVVTSFNEFHENTHIEPTEKNGTAYLEVTKKFSESLKSKGGQDPRNRNPDLDMNLVKCS